jgi:hypothetical protein
MNPKMNRGLLALALAALPCAALADDTCNGFINIDYVGAPAVSNIGDVVRMKITLGTGSIQGGTKLTIDSFQLNLDCNANFPLVPPCTDEGAIIEYEGDAFPHLTTDCPVTWSTGHPASANPNQVVFTATPALEIPAGVATPPGFCSIEFDVKVLSPDTDGDGAIEQLVGYDVAECDNGVLVSGGFQTSDIITPPPLHFSCYQIPRGGITAQKVNLVDRFGSTMAKLTAIHRLCAPTDKNDEDPTAPLSPVHLAGLTISNTTGTFSKPKGLTVANQFGTYTLDVVAPVLLLTPTAKSLAAPAPPPLGPLSVPHFQCYRLNNVKGPAPTGIHVEDQFTAPFGGITLAVDARGPDRLCVPVDKNGEDPTAPTNPNVLMCFHTKNDTLPFNQRTVFLTNQFGSFKETLTQYDELCVPSTLP